MKNDSFIDQMLQKGRDASKKAIAAFDNLSVQQLNWKPSPDKWSIAQCLDHLVVSNTQYFPVLEKIAAGNFKPGFWERTSPFSRFFGKLMVKELGETPKRKFKSPAVFQPSKSNIEDDIILRFNTHLDKLLNLISVFDKVDLEKTIIKSPSIAFITYNLRDAITIIIQHLHRHINQGVRVLEEKEFPVSLVS